MKLSYVSEYGKKGTGNLLIEGDNFLVLQQIQEDYLQRIDLITIDPPYNTRIPYIGYKDSGFDEGWRNFIEERLALAKGFLSETGVIFINIDENELFNLLDVCYWLFGPENVSILIWPKVDERFDKNRIEKPVRNVRSTHEFIVLCYNNREKTHFKTMKDGKPLESIISGCGTTSSAKDEVADLLGDRLKFSTPKPVALIKELIRVSTTRNSIVMDFFAGSGTAGHAVMDLNKEDGGRRRFILITNNESGICESVTYPRLRACIDANQYSDGFSYLRIED